MNDRTNYNRNSTHRRPASAKRRSTPQKHGLVSGVADVFKKEQKAPDYIFLTLIVLLLTYGIIMLYSAGSARAYSTFGDSFWYLKRQLVYMVLGAGVMFFFSRFDYHNLGGKVALALYGGVLFLLFLVIAGLGTTINGATRWLFGFQPSEFAKIAIIILFSHTLGSPQGQKSIKSFKYSFIPHMAMLGIYILLLLLQPHFSCAILIGLTACILMFAAGMPKRFFVLVLTIAVPIGAIMIIIKPYILARIVSFMDPFADMQGSGWQVVQSLYAIGSGGIFGVGLGNSRQKFQSLPEPYNDFIFSVLCEELGLIGATLLVLLFIFLLIRGIQIALKAPDLFGTLLGIGFVGIVLIQAALNIAVVTATAPNTGISLPFFSYGGTALVITMAEMGIVLNISRQSKSPI